MQKKEIKLEFDLYGKWMDVPPVYRIYVDDELMTERSYHAQEYEFYREKTLVELEPGEHHYRVEILPITSAKTALAVKQVTIDGTPSSSPFTVTE